jgi:hypothetical protein
MCSNSLELSGDFTVARARGGVVLFVGCDARYLWDGRDIGVDIMRGLDQLDRTLLALPLRVHLKPCPA